eukprot:365968-Chlamydomonas_euryale.AAC.15
MLPALRVMRPLRGAAAAAAAASAAPAQSVQATAPPPAPTSRLRRSSPPHVPCGAHSVTAAWKLQQPQRLPAPRLPACAACAAHAGASSGRCAPMQAASHTGTNTSDRAIGGRLATMSTNAGARSSSSSSSSCSSSSSTACSSGSGASSSRGGGTAAATSPSAGGPLPLPGDGPPPHLKRMAVNFCRVCGSPMLLTTTGETQGGRSDWRHVCSNPECGYIDYANPKVRDGARPSNRLNAGTCFMPTHACT